MSDGYARCMICTSPLDIPGRPWIKSCGGDCLVCMADAGDPDCVAAVAAMQAGEAVVIAARILVKSADNYSMGGRTRVSDDALTALRSVLPAEKGEEG